MGRGGDVGGYKLLYTDGLRPVVWERLSAAR